MTDALRGAVVAAVNALGAMLIAFHVMLTTDQLASVGTFVNAVLGIWLLARHQKSKPA